MLNAEVCKISSTRYKTSLTIIKRTEVFCKNSGEEQEEPSY